MDIVEVGQLVLQGGTLTALGVALMWIKDLQAQIRILEEGRASDGSKISILYERLVREESKGKF